MRWSIEASIPGQLNCLEVSQFDFFPLREIRATQGCSERGSPLFCSEYVYLHLGSPVLDAL
jgi:hypothetical protein